MPDEVDILKQYIAVLEERRLFVAASLLNDNSPPELQINTAAKNANSFVQINAGIVAAKNALAQITSASPETLFAPVPIAPF
ncbi:hypothetical protein [Rhizobium sp. SL42]|uniref:hypothetical protein n=1 Tax=Rhizobium sp. SL42 TaxID=2806346 RepID=UPI001F29DC10|nr:hypothetical protein [Rhizobium sp. SL42]UJW77674.1 hypothetical protein IM739_22390 [Rhizobium sp. SL42]